MAFKNVQGVNIREGQELLKLKDNVGTKTKGYKLTLNKLSLEIRRGFLILRGVGLQAATRYKGEGQKATMVKVDLSRLVDTL